MIVFDIYCYIVIYAVDKIKIKLINENKKSLWELQENLD